MTPILTAYLICVVICAVWGLCIWRRARRVRRLARQRLECFNRALQAYSDGNKELAMFYDRKHAQLSARENPFREVAR